MSVIGELVFYINYGRYLKLFNISKKLSQIVSVL